MGIGGARCGRVVVWRLQTFKTVGSVEHVMLVNRDSDKLYESKLFASRSGGGQLLSCGIGGQSHTVQYLVQYAVTTVLLYGIDMCCNLLYVLKRGVF